MIHLHSVMQKVKLNVMVSVHEIIFLVENFSLDAHLILGSYYKEIVL